VIFWRKSAAVWPFASSIKIAARGVQGLAMAQSDRKVAGLDPIARLQAQPAGIGQAGSTTEKIGFSEAVASSALG
jgi:hypothetical protein